MTPNDHAAEPAYSGWLNRNWKWFLPVGCLVPVLCCATFGAVTSIVASKAIEASVPFKTGLEKASANPEVVAALGTPLETRLGVTGSIDETNGDGTADFLVPIEGPRGRGTLDVKGRSHRGEWSYTHLHVVVGNRIIPLIPFKRTSKDEEPRTGSESK